MLVVVRNLVVLVVVILVTLQMVIHGQGNLADSVQGNPGGHDGGNISGSGAGRCGGGGWWCWCCWSKCGTPATGGDGGAWYSTTINIQKSWFVNPSANKGFGGVGPTSAPTPNGFDTSGNFWFAGGGGGGLIMEPDPGGWWWWIWWTICWWWFWWSIIQIL